MITKTACFFITGDIAKDYFLVRGERLYAGDQHLDHARTRIVHHKGGVCLISELPEELAQVKRAFP